MKYSLTELVTNFTQYSVSFGGLIQDLPYLGAGTSLFEEI